MQQPIPNDQRTVAVSGRVFYTERRRRIDLKKPVRDLLEESINPVHYVMEVSFNKEDIVKRIDQLVSARVYPVLLYFVKKEEDK